jgi:hypothetical protein
MYSENTVDNFGSTKACKPAGNVKIPTVADQ